MASKLPQTVKVTTKEQLESTISQYIGRGYTVANRSETFATMHKPKKFNVALGIVGFLCCCIGLIIYAIYYSTLPEVSVIEIKVV
jgi:hypothetical protein